MKISVYIILCFCFFFSFSSCKEEGPLLSETDLNMIDTLYEQQIELHKSELDSLCQLTYDNTFNASTDSIKSIRLEEIKAILGK